MQPCSPVMIPIERKLQYFSWFYHLVWNECRPCRSEWRFFQKIQQFPVLLLSMEDYALESNTLNQNWIHELVHPMNNPNQMLVEHLPNWYQRNYLIFMMNKNRFLCQYSRYICMWKLLISSHPFHMIPFALAAWTWILLILSGHFRMNHLSLLCNGVCLFSRCHSQHPMVPVDFIYIRWLKMQTISGKWSLPWIYFAFCCSPLEMKFCHQLFVAAMGVVCATNGPHGNFRVREHGYRRVWPASKSNF